MVVISITSMLLIGLVCYAAGVFTPAVWWMWRTAKRNSNGSRH